MDNAVFNKNVSMLQERFQKQFIPIDEAADYVGPDKRTLAARKDFPLVSMGNRKGVFLVRFAEWLTNAGVTS